MYVRTLIYLFCPDEVEVVAYKYISLTGCLKPSLEEEPFCPQTKPKIQLNVGP